jgi:hypothetical protein
MAVVLRKSLSRAGLYAVPGPAGSLVDNLLVDVDDDARASGGVLAEADAAHPGDRVGSWPRDRPRDEDKAWKGKRSTRALVCALDPKCERPEERRFTVNLHESVPARRGELVAAALTVPLAYLADGAPPQDVPPFGRFEDWARWCRHPLVWLGEADPCASRQRIEDRDPVREQLSALLTTWHRAFGESGQTVAAAVALDTTDARGDPIARAADLREAIAAIAQQGRGINTRMLGNFISKHENRRESGLRFTRAGERSGVLRWSVAP